ncbi:hypothetical protein FACS189487_00390 [Campylobacterota bacterium]|nr:hypothetical protein FACS189487_00390 [Campylobacterota bacterium]
MSIISECESICSVCGNANRYPMLRSTIALINPDLDSRPSEMTRSTMVCWVQVCPSCGYAARDVSDPFACGQEFLQSDEYKLFSPLEPVGSLTKAFIWKARINDRTQKFVASFFDYLRAAWDADDNGDSHWSKQARLLALEQFDKVDQVDRTDDLLLIRTDLLRKTEQFERLLREYESVRFDGDQREEFGKVIAFQLQKARIWDTATYTFGDVALAMDKPKPAEDTKEQTQEQTPKQTPDSPQTQQNNDPLRAKSKPRVTVCGISRSGLGANKPKPKIDPPQTQWIGWFIVWANGLWR